MRVGVWAMAGGVILGASLMLVERAAEPQPPIDGFTAAHVDAQREVEDRIATFPSRRRLEADHQFLTAEPHVAGSARDRLLAEWTRDQWIAAGLDVVEIVEHHARLPYPRDAAVEMIAPHAWHATLREDANAPLAFHAYSANGDVTAAVVDARTGTEADFERLASRGVDVRGKILLIRHPTSYSYRGAAVYLAQQRGAAAVLTYAEHVDGVPDDRIQRGSIGFDFIAAGDPTPETLPSILSLPISPRDAHTILDAMKAGDVTLHVRVSTDEATRPVWTVIGRINGSTYPDQWVIAGNHRDAWTYGGVDPSSGSAVLMETARALGSLAKNGARPKRTIVLASWDAEEFALTSSTKWAEQHESELREQAVAYVNVDAAVSGATFSARAVPSLAHLVAAAAGVAESTIDTRIGAGSDYTVFLHHLGVPIIDMRFQGPYEVYHSAYDTHDWIARVDPGFRRHADLTRIWSTVATRLANADLLPLEPVRYAKAIREFLGELEARAGTRLPIARDAAARFEAAAVEHASAAATALAANDTAALDALNRALMDLERSLIDQTGLEDRPWYRHQIYAPAFTYQAMVLPGLAEATARRDPAKLAASERRLAAALDRAAKVLATSVVQGS